MPAVLDQGSPCGAASSKSLAVQAAVGSRTPQTSRDAAGSHTTAGHVASPPAFQKLQINASCCSAYSGQLPAVCIVTDVLPLSSRLDSMSWHCCNHMRKASVGASTGSELLVRESVWSETFMLLKGSGVIGLSCIFGYNGFSVGDCLKSSCCRQLQPTFLHLLHATIP